MSIFKITTPISKAKFDTAKTNEDTYKSNVHGFDTTPTKNDAVVTWTIDMTGGVKKIEDAMAIASERIGNVSVAIDSVNNNHDKLQASLKFTAPYVMGYAETHTPKNSTNSPTTPYDSNLYQSGSGFGSSAGTGGMSVMDPLSAFGEDEDEFLDMLEDETEILEEEEEKEDEIIDSELKIDTIAFLGLEEFLPKLKEDGTLEKILSQYNISSEHPLIVQDSKGYVRIDASAIPKKERPTDVDIVGKENRYLVVCSSDVGQVGEVLRFKNGDDVIECVVAYNDNSAGKESTMTFVVAEDKFQEESTKVMEELLSGVDEYSHIENKTFDRVDNLCNMRVLESGTRV